MVKRRLFQTLLWNKILVVLGWLEILLDLLRVALKKRRCLGSAHVLNEVVEREISQLSKEEALRFQALFAHQAERANVMDEGTLSILRLEEEANERDAVLLGTQG